MTPSEREYLEMLERRIQNLERRRFPRLIRGLLPAIPLLAVTLLSASVTTTGSEVIESRLVALESLIRPGPDGSVQTRVPFQVLDRRGKVLLNVGDRAAAGAVNVMVIEGTGAAGLRVVGTGGNDAAIMGVDASGSGRISNLDASGNTVAQFNSVGLNVYDTGGDPVAGVTRGSGLGRVAVWRGPGKTAVEITSDVQGNGRLSSYVNGKLRAAIRSEGFGVFDESGRSVVSIINRNGRGVVGVNASVNSTLTTEMTVDSGGGGVFHMKAPDGKIAIGLYAARRLIALGNSQGATVAEMTVHPAGYGLFQVWGGGKMPLAVLGKSADHFGGIVQISNGNSIISSLTVSPGGNGMWQLNDAAGKTVIEAGVTGRLGTVRVGPLMRCIPRPSSLVLPDCLLGRAQ